MSKTLSGQEIRKVLFEVRKSGTLVLRATCCSISWQLRETVHSPPQGYKMKIVYSRWSAAWLTSFEMEQKDFMLIRI